MNKIFSIFGLSFLLFISSCQKDDSLEESFLHGALTSATNQQLEGRWAIFQLKFDNQTVNVPIDYPECGRSFFDFKPQSVYKEYIFSSSNCIPTVNTVSWTLSQGIITLSNDTASDKWVITELTAERLVFKTLFDFDSDNRLDIIEVVCYRYTPPAEIDIFSHSFYWDSNDDSLDKILLKWEKYNGYNNFVKYEIYRMEADCNTANAVLIATITDANTDSYIDLTPPPLEAICYQFKIYTSEGLLGESDAVTVDTSRLKVPNVNLSMPQLNGNTVQLNWQQYQGYYFSHYEIEVRNYATGNGGGSQQEQLATINTKETTHISVEQPYFNNPVFVIQVYNIFGSHSAYVIEGQNQRSTNFTRNEILPVNFIKFFAFSPNETVIYFTDYTNLYRYNYNTNIVESSKNINSSSITFLKVFQTSFGTEVVMNIGSTMRVYDSNLNFKYDFETSNSVSSDYVTVTQNGYWLVVDRQKMYSYTRSGSSLNLINSNNLYNHFFCCSSSNMIDIGQNRIFVGNYDELHGLIVNIDTDGILATNATPVSFNTASSFNNHALFSANKKYVLDVNDNTLYSTESYNLLNTLSQNFFATGLSNDGSKILGTLNNPSASNDYFHEKKVRIFSYPSYSEQIHNAKGYPIVLYQNHLGQIVCLSKGLIGNIGTTAQENDIFIEIIN